jgi:retron-type reverse transcriptase
MEKLVDRYIRDEIIRISSLHRNQFAYQMGKSTETALHNVVTRIENAMEHKEIALGSFLDIEGAFDRTSFAAIAKAAERHGVESTIGRWINSMLESKSMIATLTGQTLEVSVTKGCPQGGMLSPLLWSLVVDELLGELNEGGYHAIGYADDLAILINGKRLQSQRYCKQAWDWSNSGAIGQVCPSTQIKRW